MSNVIMVAMLKLQRDEGTTSESIVKEKKSGRERAKIRCTEEKHLTIYLRDTKFISANELYIPQMNLQVFSSQCVNIGGGRFRSDLANDLSVTYTRKTLQIYIFIKIHLEILISANARRNCCGRLTNLFFLHQPFAVSRACFAMK